MSEWRKSSYSGTQVNSDCVELANLGPEIGIRDSKSPETGHHTVSREALKDLVSVIKAGELDL